MRDEYQLWVLIGKNWKCEGFFATVEEAHEHLEGQGSRAQAHRLVNVCVRECEHNPADVQRDSGTPEESRSGPEVGG